MKKYELILSEGQRVLMDRAIDFCIDNQTLKGPITRHVSLGLLALRFSAKEVGSKMNWEYKVLSITDNSNEIQTLDIYGAAGWELVQVIPEDTVNVEWGNVATIHHFYLKRRKEVKPNDV